MDAFVSGVDYQDNAYISSDDNDDLPLENLINSSDDDEPLNYSTFEKCVSEYLHSGINTIFFRFGLKLFYLIERLQFEVCLLTA